MSDASIFLGVPHYGELVAEAITSLINPTCKHRLKIQTNCASLLAHNFNRLWCSALNDRDKLGLTHFAMHHADVCAPSGWLDTMLEEMERVGADILSSVIPLKDSRGLTSTAVRDRVTNRIRRITLKELHEYLPVTFDIGDIEEHLGVSGDPELLVNTGLWVCRFTNDWIRRFPGFTIADAITKDPDGRYGASVYSEDWSFSSWCHNNRVKVFATRIIPVTHFGRALFKRDSPWGEWATDHGENQ
jgi:hypothetical protein